MGLGVFSGGSGMAGEVQSLFGLQGSVDCDNHATNQHRCQNGVVLVMKGTKRHRIFLAALWHLGLTNTEDGVQRSRAEQVTREQ